MADTWAVPETAIWLAPEGDPQVYVAPSADGPIVILPDAAAVAWLMVLDGEAHLLADRIHEEADVPPGKARELADSLLDQLASTGVVVRGQRSSSSPSR